MTKIAGSCLITILVFGFGYINLPDITKKGEYIPVTTGMILFGVIALTFLLVGAVGWITLVIQSYIRSKKL